VSYLAAVIDREANRITKSRRTRQPHDDGVAGTDKAKWRWSSGASGRSAAFDRAGNSPNPEPPAHAQHHGIEAGPKRHQRGRDVSIERSCIPVEVRDFDALVNQVEIMGWSVAAAEDALGVGLL
jgi:hypothetical protein